jgi:small subunit ribosomal protein S5
MAIGMEDEVKEFTEKVVKIDRVAKVVKGGRRFSFNALTVVGDSKNRVGIGFGKANEVPDAIRKSIDSAKKNLVKINIIGHTIPHEVVGRFKSARVHLKPCSPGTGIIAGEAVRSVVEKAGVQDILSKSYGSGNPLNIVKATYNALQQLETPVMSAKKRGISIKKLFGQEG